MKIRRTSTCSGLGTKNLLRVPIPKDVQVALALQSGDVLLWTLDGKCLQVERADGP